MQQPTKSRTPNDPGSPSSDFSSLDWGDSSSSQEREPAPSPASPSFAGLLAALTEPAQPVAIPANESLSSKQKPASSWSDDDLADDVAILSYESALKAHARYRPSQISDRSLTQPATAEPYCYEEASSDLSLSAQQPVAQRTANVRAIPSLEPASTPVPDFTSGAGFLRTAPFERNLKEASITIRMSKAECAQLHRRAAEAGLTVSAYLRSCTFEAESLRAMVKDTMAKLRAVTTQANSAAAAPPLRSRFRELAAWLGRLLTPWHSSQRVARA
jgi:hypothetical protein